MIVSVAILFLGLTFIKGKTYLFIGDSITDGNWGSPKTYPCDTEERNLWDKNHLLGHGYVEMIAGYLAGEYPGAGISVINRGISGQTLLDIANRWDRDVIAHHPDVVTLLCGTNDIHYWLEGNPTDIESFDFKGYRQRLDSIVSITLRKDRNVEIILCTPFVAQSGSVGNAGNYDLRKSAIDKLAEIDRDIVERYSKEQVRVMDFNKLLLELERENPDMEYWVWDGIHPTTAMHYRMAKKWLEDRADFDEIYKKTE